jgi:hypothetical protein
MKNFTVQELQRHLWQIQPNVSYVAMYGNIDRCSEDKNIPGN